VIRVVIAEDYALVRGSFRLLLDSADDLTVVGEASDGAEAVEVVARCQPDVVLMDVEMPGMNGIDAATRILAGSGTVKVVMLTTHDLDEYVYAALRAGASGFLLKDIQPDELLRAVRVVAEGEALLAPTVTRRLLGEFTARAPQPRPALTGITEREREVLVLVARALSNQDIATELGVSLHTAKTHVGRLLTKLGARDRTHLVVLAYESGLVRAGES
jgi:DNA-binding NarL/FixJ family response regulator